MCVYIYNVQLATTYSHLVSPLKCVLRAQTISCGVRPEDLER